MKNWQKKYFNPEFYNPACPRARTRAPQEAAFAIKAIGAKKGWRILDIACGPGRHSIEFARKGMAITGLDFCKPYLNEARANAKTLKLDIKFVHGDMRKMPFDSEFDAAICMFTSFGYFDEAGNMRVLKSIAKALKPGGKLLLDIMSRDAAAALPPREWQCENETFELEEREFDHRRGIITNRIIYMRPGEKPVESGFVVRVYNAQTLSKLLLKAGLKPLAFWDRLNFAKSSAQGNRLVALAVKGE
jgi:ubiquinone/menaquinone biosynthesis C-methylase UbiE